MSNYLLKHIPEDFIVEETIDLDIADSGEFVYFSLGKKNVNTQDAVERIARSLGIPAKKMSYAGRKDKRALTTQVCSAPAHLKERIEKLQLENIKLEVLGFGSSPIFLGANKGNTFRITLRKVTSQPKIPSVFYNYFGPQRFSTANVEIGRFLIQRKFNDAVQKIKETQKIPLTQQMPAMQELRTVKMDLLKLFVHAYQSYLWNQAVKLSAEKGNCPAELELPGFNLESEEHYAELFAKDMITSRDFVFREIPSLSAESLKRETQVIPGNLKVSPLETDEDFPGEKKCMISFSLPKGSYATVILEQLFR